MYLAVSLVLFDGEAQRKNFLLRSSSADFLRSDVTGFRAQSADLEWDLLGDSDRLNVAQTLCMQACEWQSKSVCD